MARRPSPFAPQLAGFDACFPAACRLLAPVAHPRSLLDSVLPSALGTCLPRALGALPLPCFLGSVLPGLPEMLPGSSSRVSVSHFPHLCIFLSCLPLGCSDLPCSSLSSTALDRQPISDIFYFSDLTFPFLEVRCLSFSDQPAVCSQTPILSLWFQFLFSVVS